MISRVVSHNGMLTGITAQGLLAGHLAVWGSAAQPPIVQDRLPISPINSQNLPIRVMDHYVRSFVTNSKS
ncbi:hypothetical protein B0O99DRAFT_642510 [Bisporella sp. PMI_857]|nr:hypothetical protein B0O99DRAFT_642510 [Bisporella sp. PMI_857]